jgi:hypothetical protein
MSDTLVARLRARPHRRGGETQDEANIRRQQEREEAADEIERLQRMLARYCLHLGETEGHDYLWGAFTEDETREIYGYVERAKNDLPTATIQPDPTAAPTNRLP